MRIIQKVAVCLLLALSGLCIMGAQTVSKNGDDDQWPKTITVQENVFKIYQPQIDSWDGFTLKAHSAASVQQAGKKSQVSYGVASFTIKTIIDKESRLVNFDNVQIDNVAFPAEKDQEPVYLEWLRQSVPLQMKSIALDRLESSLAILEEQKKGEDQKLDNTPPKIIFSNKLSILVAIDGTPVLSPVKDTKLSRVLNTHVLLLKSGAGKYYLHVFGGYMEATTINGPWTVSKNPPQDAGIAEQNVEGVDLLNGDNDQPDNKPSLAKGDVPRIFVETVPTELIVTDGEPNFVPLEGTKLLYVSNTSANVFEDMNSQKMYVLISGRWFCAPSPAGPWQYVPADRLPEDFAKIPDASVKENVKASVPGTSEAREAVIANSIPVTSKVDRVTAHMTLEIDGQPELRPIEGTGLSYVFNSSLPVIKVDEGKWYAVYNGIWFTAHDVKGPWTVADSVPAVIYSIPTDSPLHYVTYVKVYDSTPGYVYEGYTPGYLGTEVSPDGTVVYGTGYSYPSYIGASDWYGPMTTYGFGSGLCWTPWYGWSFGFGFGWGFGNCWYYPPFPYWGPFFGWRHNFNFGFHTWELSTALNGYNRFHYRMGEHMSFSNQGHFGRAYNSITGTRIMGSSHSINHVFAAQGYSNAIGRTEYQNRSYKSPVSGYHVYGTPSGHVYYYQQRGQVGRWNSLGYSSRVPESAQRYEVNNLNREVGARQQGEFRYNSYRNYSAPGGTGMGGWHGGGMGGGSGHR